DPELAKTAKHLTTTAKLPHRWAFDHDQIGYNYRLPNINAALGCAQLEQLPGFLDAKRRLFQRYQAAFAGIEGADIVPEPEGCQSNYWLQTLLLAPAKACQHEAILAASNDSGLMTRPAWTLMNRLRSYRECPAMDLAGAESLAVRLINMPSSATLVGLHV
ncbi:MAG: DegT/DnrJ/EryC1/StrS family aminotransferase, partial [Betaproteobacteria bacterium]|nr:DegT/DnrJ/EryC1/StrS family aminotransferase [Betaproteobacteria bacterium]